MKNPEREFIGVFIPAEIWEDERINCVMRCLWGEIDALGGHAGRCWARNEYLGKQVGVSASRVSVMISELTQWGLLEVESFDGRTRKLRSIKPSGNKADSLKTNSLPIEKQILQESVDKEEDIAASAASRAVYSRKERQRGFVALWHEGYLKKLGRKYSPVPQDFKMLKEFLTTSEEMPEDMIKVAFEAWEHMETFYCGQATGLYAFLKFFNQIRGELYQAKPKRNCI